MEHGAHGAGGGADGNLGIGEGGAGLRTLEHRGILRDVRCR